MNRLIPHAEWVQQFPLSAEACGRCGKHHRDIPSDVAMQRMIDEGVERLADEIDRQQVMSAVYASMMGRTP